MDDTAEGGLTQFWELFTVIPCASKDFKGGGYWLKLGVTTRFLQSSVEREPQVKTRQMYIFLERS